MSTQYVYFVDRFRKTRKMESRNPKTRPLDCTLISIPRIEPSIQVICLYNRIGLAGFKTKYEHNCDWPTQFCLSGDCLALQNAS